MEHIEGGSEKATDDQPKLLLLLLADVTEDAVVEGVARWSFVEPLVESKSTFLSPGSGMRRGSFVERAADSYLEDKDHPCLFGGVN